MSAVAEPVGKVACSKKFRKLCTHNFSEFPRAVTVYNIRRWLTQENKFPIRTHNVC
jgi:hypothetical protein